MGTTCKTLLLVDSKGNLKDSFDTLTLFAEWDKQYCSDSFSALQLLKKNNFDLLVMDYRIEPMDPFKLMDYIFHELQKKCQMIIVGDGSSSEGTYENYVRINYPIQENHFDFLLNTADIQERNKEEKLFSLDYLNELSDNDEEFLEESLFLFRDTLEVKFKELESALSTSNFEETRQIAHNVKPTFAMLGNEKGRSICHAMCYDAADSELEGLSTTLKNEYVLILSEIEKLFPKLKAL